MKHWLSLTFSFSVVYVNESTNWLTDQLNDPPTESIGVDLQMLPYYYINFNLYKNIIVSVKNFF